MLPCHNPSVQMQTGTLQPLHAYAVVPLSLVHVGLLVTQCQLLHRVCMPRVFLMPRLFKCVPLSWVKRRSVFYTGVAGPPLQHLQGCLAVGLQHMYKPPAT